VPKFGAALVGVPERAVVLSLVNRFNQLAMFCQRQWSDILYGVVRLLHQ
jgi:hypothetical protein